MKIRKRGELSVRACTGALLLIVGPFHDCCFFAQGDGDVTLANSKLGLKERALSLDLNAGRVPAVPEPRPPVHQLC